MHVAVAAPPRFVSTEYPCRGPSPRLVCGTSATRPRFVFTEYPRRGRGVAATRLRNIRAANVLDVDDIHHVGKDRVVELVRDVDRHVVVEGERQPAVGASLPMDLLDEVRDDRNERCEAGERDRPVLLVETLQSDSNVPSRPAAFGRSGHEPLLPPALGVFLHGAEAVHGGFGHGHFRDPRRVLVREILVPAPRLCEKKGQNRRRDVRGTVKVSRTMGRGVAATRFGTRPRAISASSVRSDFDGSDGNTIGQLGIW